MQVSLGHKTFFICVQSSTCLQYHQNVQLFKPRLPLWPVSYTYKHQAPQTMNYLFTYIFNVFFTKKQQRI